MLLQIHTFVVNTMKNSKEMINPKLWKSLLSWMNPKRGTQGGWKGSPEAGSMREGFTIL